MATGYFAGQVQSMAAPILGRKAECSLATENTNEIIATSAILSCFSRLLAEKLILLDGRTLADGDSIEIEE